MLAAPDQALLCDPNLSRRFVAMVRETLRQVTLGLQYGTALMVSPWGFDPAGVRTPTYLWQGAEDLHATPAMAHYLTDTTPHAQLELVPGEAHISLFEKRLQGVLTTITYAT